MLQGSNLSWPTKIKNLSSERLGYFLLFYFMSTTTQSDIFLSKFDSIKEIAFNKIEKDDGNREFWENIILTLYSFSVAHPEKFETPPFEVI